MLEHLILQCGGSVLGVGGAAFAYQHPDLPGRAVKVGLDSTDGWPAWADWSSRHPGPHVPRVDTLQWLSGPRGDRFMYVAIVEALEPSEWARGWLRPDRSLKKRPLDFAALIRAEHPSIADMLEAAAAAFPNGSWDMHRANWLQRADGTVVLNDPLAHP